MYQTSSMSLKSLQRSRELKLGVRCLQLVRSLLRQRHAQLFNRWLSMTTRPAASWVVTFTLAQEDDACDAAQAASSFKILSVT